MIAVALVFFKYFSKHYFQWVIWFCYWFLLVYYLKIDYWKCSLNGLFSIFYSYSLFFGITYSLFFWILRIYLVFLAFGFQFLFIFRLPNIVCDLAVYDNCCTFFDLITHFELGKKVFLVGWMSHEVYDLNYWV